MGMQLSAARGRAGFRVFGLALRAKQFHQFPRGSTYTTIRELGSNIPSIVSYFGA